MSVLSIEYGLLCVLYKLYISLIEVVAIALAFRKYIGGEKRINDYCHELALTGGRCVAAILKTEVMDSDKIPEELIGNMVRTKLSGPPSCDNN